MEEVWKDIQDYEGYYQVSNLGRVRSVDRIVSHWRGGKQLKKGKMLKPYTDKHGYKHVTLSKDRKGKCVQVHRLVAFAFIPNPNNLKEVNHIDENPSNNCVDNLEWCTKQYNINYGTRNERMLQNRSGIRKSKPVLQYTFNGEFVAEYPSLMEAYRQTGISFANISCCCRGKKRKDKRGYYTPKTAGGFIWKYK